ncbi:tetratricopeptide repeat protein [Halocola ammonii]
MTSIICASGGIGKLQAQSDAQDAFERGNEAYQSENYEQALENYLSAASDAHSFELYFNLGNTYFKLDSLGKSILYYERAREIKPKNEDIVVNLQIARQQLIDKIEPLPSLGVNSFWERVTAESNLTTYATLSIVGLFLSAAIYLLMLLFRNKPSLRSPLRMVFIFLMIFSLGSLFLAYQTNNRLESQKSAVIMVPVTDVVLSPEGSAKKVFELHEGTKVEITERSGEWVKVKLVNGSTGWLKFKALEVI